MNDGFEGGFDMFEERVGGGGFVKLWLAEDPKSHDREEDGGDGPEEAGLEAKRGADDPAQKRTQYEAEAVHEADAAVVGFVIGAVAGFFDEGVIDD